MKDKNAPPRYGWGFFFMRRALGVVYLVAFFSLAFQVDGLFGAQGIMPVEDLLRRLVPGCGPNPVLTCPTVFWWSASDFTLLALCWVGMAFALLLLLGLLPQISLFVLWILYLSFVTVGQDFLQYQWDVLLLEATLLAFLTAPFSIHDSNVEPSAMSRYVTWFLVVRLMFSAGYVKLASGDPTWSGYDALSYHFLTQPLPHWVSWYASKLPEEFHRVACRAVLGIELVLPCVMFGPRFFRHIAAFGTIVFMVLIALTGNYGFFNILTIGLLFSLLDDRCWGRILGPIEETFEGRSGWDSFSTLAASVLGVIHLLSFLDTLGVETALAERGRYLLRIVAPYHVSHMYGLFAVMVTDRLEINLEGSNDGVDWLAYDFKYKPDAVDEAPRWAAPLHPRLDWQMWFASLQNPDQNLWFQRLQRRLLEGSPPVLRLLKPGPFVDRPPKFIRATLYRYRFSTWEEREKTGEWWVRSQVGPYSPAYTLNRSGG